MQLGSLEQRVMNHIWDQFDGAEFTVREVLDTVNHRGNDYAYNTILTVVTHLYDKKLLTRKKIGKACLYQVRVCKNTFVAEASRKAFEQLQKEYGTLAIAHFAHLMETVDPKLLKEAKAKLAASQQSESTGK